MKKQLLISMLVFSSLFSSAQVAFDALRFSMLSPGGTARSLGAAGAFGAIGADFSTLSNNPAGIGLFRSSEFTFSPSLHYASAEANYNGKLKEDDRYNFNIANAGVVFAMGNNKNEQNKWKKVQVGFGVNRLANFNSNIAIAGNNPNNSIIHELQENARGLHPDALNDFDTRLAWETYLFSDTIRTFNDTIKYPLGLLEYTSAIPNGGVLQTKSIKNQGALNEMVLSFGGNYNDRLFIGATFGFPTLTFKQDATYREIDDGDSIPGFGSMSIYDHLYTTGSGFNFKLGIISRPFDWVRIGAAIHTPTFFNMKDEYWRNMKHKRDQLPEIEYGSPKGYFDYSLRTPLRAILSLGFIIKQYGFIGIDYEFVDYSEAKLESSKESFSDVNDIIHTDYRSTSNIRIGGELNINPFRLRAGYSLYRSPYANNLNDFEKSSITFGLGFREKNYFMDFAFIMTSFNEDYYLYSPKMVNPTKIENFTSTMIMTLGLRF